MRSALKKCEIFCQFLQIHITIPIDLKKINFSSLGCCNIDSLAGPNADGEYFKENAIDSFDAKERLGKDYF